MRKITQDNPLCCDANPALWKEFCELTNRKPYRSEIWTLRDCETLVEFLRKQPKNRLRQYARIRP